MEYDVSEAEKEAPLKDFLTFPIPLEENDPYLLIEFVNHSLMKVSGGMKELDGFTFGIKKPKELQPTGVKSVLHLIPGLSGCFILCRADLDCFDEDHPQNSHKRLLMDETIIFYIL